MAKVSLRAYNREIEAMIDRGQLDEAIAHCHHILKTFPKHLETYRLLGKAYLEYKRYKDAVDIFSRVLVVEPNDFVANVGMSIVRDEENKLDDAIWHMERAFEVQSANPAIQGEMQRLYGRREGVQPPRIRMTRGALAHMYVQGELYPQAISEVKSVLKDDPGRTDMQVLMARAYFKSGQKTEAADTASSVLRRYPYCLDANRILVEILGTDRPENSQLYRQRVIELDPYAAQVSGSIFDSKEVGDNAVSLERLDWNGQPVGLQSDWESTRAVRLESENKPGPQVQPDWLKSGSFTDSTPLQPTPFDTAQDKPKVVPPLPALTPSFDIPTEPPIASQPAQPTPEAEIPDFLREAGWGQSTGTFDESKLSFTDEPVASASVSDALPIEQGDMPDWVKAMAPPQEIQPAEEEELPDWINKIGTGALPPSAVPTSSDDQFDWMNQPDQPAQSSVPASDDQPDWAKSFDQPAASQPAADDQPDWMKGFGNETESTSLPASIEQPDWMKELEQPASQPLETSDQPDWMKGFGNEPESMSAPASIEQPDWTKELEQPASQPVETSDQPDWMKGFGNEPESTSAPSSVEQPDWMTQFGNESSETAPAASLPAENEFDFLNELTAEPIPPAASATDTGSIGKSQSEIDDSLAWLENLAAKQGATEGLLIKPEDRMEKEPDWVSQIESTPQRPAANVAELGKSQTEIDDSLAWLENLAAKQGATEGLLIKPEDRMEKEPDWVSQVKSTPQAPAQPAANVEELGKSQSEIDDSLAWLENLAAKQGATEGLLIKPEDRMEKEPDWVSQVKSVPQSPVQQPAANVEELGKSQSEIDDSLAWMENLAAKQGATEGLLIKPEDRMEKEPDWVSQVKGVPQEPPASPTMEQPVAYEKQTISADDTAAWLRSLDEEESKPEPASAHDETGMWFRALVEPEPAAQGAQPAPTDDVPEWMQGMGEEQAPIAESVVPLKEAVDDSDWLNSIEEPVASSEPAAVDENIPSWLKGVDEESKISASMPQDDLPAWMRDEAGEAVAEPVKIEPTRSTDWQPVEEKQPEPPAPQPVVQEQTKPEPLVVPVQEKSRPAPVKRAEPKPEEVKPATPPEPYREPVTRRGTGMLVMPTDPILSSARNELARSNIPGALETYAKLIKKGRFLDEVIFDLREALYRYPVEVSIWQSLGDAYMRANRLQDALDAYTKAEELLR